MATHHTGEREYPVEEIKPVGLDRSEPAWALRRAYLDTLDGLTLELLGKTFGTGKTSAEHLRSMAREIFQNIRTMPVDKMGRWVGFIQGVMAANGVLDVDAERERTRPFFNPAVEPVKPMKPVNDTAKCEEGHENFFACPRLKSERGEWYDCEKCPLHFKIDEEEIR